MSKTPGWPSGNEPADRPDLRTWLCDRATWFRNWNASRVATRPFPIEWQQEIVLWMATPADQPPSDPVQRKNWAEELICLWWDTLLVVLNGWFDVRGISGYPRWTSLRADGDPKSNSFFRIESQLSSLLAFLAPATGGAKNLTCGPEKRLPPRPSVKAFRAWHVRDALALTTGEPKQQDIADAMTRQGCPATQGQVSKWLAAVKEYGQAGGIIPTPYELSRGDTDTVDPDVIDMGSRRDGLTKRQRLRRDDDADSWSE